MSILHPVCDHCDRPVRPDTEEPREWVHEEDSFYTCPGDYYVAKVFGSSLVPTLRHAEVLSKSSSKETVQNYLPSNYEAYEKEGVVRIIGFDNAGWGLDTYVIPRLASGLHTVKEVTD